MAAAATASAASWTGSASGSNAAQGVGGGAHVRALQAVAPPVASASRLDIRRQCPCVDLPHSHSHGRTVALAKFVKNLMLRHSHGRTVALRARSTQQPRVAAPQLAMGLRVAGRGWGPDRRSKSSPVAAV